jgi:superfamily II DNA or RNA helicase
MNKIILDKNFRICAIYIMMKRKKVFESKEKTVIQYVKSVGTQRLREVKYQDLKLKTTLKPHQTYIRKVIEEHRTARQGGHNGDGDLVYLPPGMGKTLIALDVIVQHLKTCGEEAGGILIVLPKSIVEQWQVFN